MFSKQRIVFAVGLFLILFCQLAAAQGDAEGHFKRGEAYLQSEQLTDAVAEFKQAIRINPKWAEAHFKLGEAYSATPISDPGYPGRQKDALKAFQEALKLKPDWAEAHNEVGRKLQGDEAIKSYKEAIRLKPEFTAAHENLAIALLYKQRHQEAIESLLVAIRLEPSRPLAHKLLGLAYLIVDERDKAKAEYELLKSLDAVMADYLNKAIQQPTKPYFGVLTGKLLSVPVPQYPEEAKRRNITGDVVVKVVINEAGLVAWAKAASGPEELWSAAEAAALKARFKPTKLSGKLVPVTGQITFRFRP